MIILLMGVSGSGKTTIGRRLADDLGWPFYDGDDFHPPANVERMARGIPLTDADRMPWLDALRTAMDALAAEGRSAVVACSALKQAYRYRLMHGQEAVRLVYLRGPYALIQERIESRHGHFFDPDLLRSQFETLEAPSDGIAVDVALSPEEIVREIRRAVGV